MKINLKETLLIGLITFSSTGFSGSMMNSSEPMPYNNPGFRFSAYLGPNWAHVSPSNIFLNGENDSLNFATQPTDFTWGFGAAYRWLTPNIYPLNLHDVSLGLDIIYFRTQQQGQTWQYDSPAFYNYNYQLPVSNLRFMFNTEWTIQPLPMQMNLFSQSTQIYPFIDAGIGVTRNTLSYNDTPVPGFGGAGLIIISNAQSQFAWDVGAGLKIPFQVKDHAVEASVRYLYTGLGHATTSGLANATLVAPMTINFSTQALLFGLSVLV